MRAVLQLLEHPYDHSWTNLGDSGGICKTVGGEEGEGEEDVVGRYKGKPTPEWAADLVCTCSS